MRSFFVVAGLLASSNAFAFTTIGECDNRVRVTADNAACACITEAMIAIDDNGGVRAGADYSAWESSISYPKSGSVVVTVPGPSGSSFTNTCFDMVNLVDTASWDLRLAQTNSYANIASKHADGVTYGSTVFQYTPTLGGPILGLLGGGGMVMTEVPGQFGTWTTMGTTLSPDFPWTLPGGHLLPLDAFTLMMEDENGNELGLLVTGGQDFAGMSLDMDGQTGQLVANVYFLDGSHVTVHGLGQGTVHFMQ